MHLTCFPALNNHHGERSHKADEGLERREESGEGRCREWDVEEAAPASGIQPEWRGRRCWMSREAVPMPRP